MGQVLFQVFWERVPMSCLQWLDALEANNWKNSKVQQNHKFWLHTILWMASCHHGHGVACDAHHITYIHCSNLLWTITKFLTSDMHSTWGCASQTSGDAHSKVGAHLGKLWPLTRNWVKREGGHPGTMATVDLALNQAFQKLGFYDPQLSFWQNNRANI